MFKFRNYFKRTQVEVDGNMLIMYNCTLKKPIGDYKIGYTFPVVEFDFIELEMYFYDEKDNVVMKRGFLLDDNPFIN